MKKIISVLCFVSFSTVVIAEPVTRESDITNSRTNLTIQAFRLNAHIRDLLSAKDLDQVKVLVTRDLQRQVSKSRKTLVNMWRSGRDGDLSKIYDKISQKDSNYIPRVLDWDRNNSLDKATAMLHLFSESSIPKMVQIMMEDIVKSGGLKVFQAKLKSTLLQTEIFQDNPGQNELKNMAQPMNGFSMSDCDAFALMGIAFAISIVLLPVAIFMIPIYWWNCSI